MLHWLYVYVFVNVINWYRGYQCSLSSLVYICLICSISCGISNRPRVVIAQKFLVISSDKPKETQRVSYQDVVKSPQIYIMARSH